MSAWKKIDEVPFDFQSRRVSVLVENKSARRLIVKGAPEDLLRLSKRYEDATGDEKPLDDETRRPSRQRLTDSAAKDSACLELPRAKSGKTMTWPRPATRASSFSRALPFSRSPESERRGHDQGSERLPVAVKVVTGDNELVTRHVFSTIGVPVTGVLNGDALSKLSDEALIGQLSQVNLFCRVNPQQKHRILLALKRVGNAGRLSGRRR